MDRELDTLDLMVTKVVAGMEYKPTKTEEFVPLSVARDLRRRALEAEREGLEQARLLGMSGSRELALRTRVEELTREVTRQREEIRNWVTVHDQCRAEIEEKVRQLASANDLIDKVQDVAFGLRYAGSVCSMIRGYKELAALKERAE